MTHPPEDPILLTLQLPAASESRQGGSRTWGRSSTSPSLASWASACIPGSAKGLIRGLGLGVKVWGLRAYRALHAHTIGALATGTCLARLLKRRRKHFPPVPNPLDRRLEGLVGHEAETRLAAQNLGFGV